MGRLAGKTCIVTGAASGMGAATARIFLEEGANVVAADIAETFDVTPSKETHRRFLARRLDVSRRTEWTALVAEVIARFGTVDVLVNNAGIFKPERFADVTDDEFERILAVNLKGPLIGMQSVYGAMAAQRSGSIINIISTESIRGMNGMTAYGASKWGLRGLTKVAAMELGLLGIRVNAIHPGSTDTPLFNPHRLDPAALKARTGSLFRAVPLQRICEPDEIARATLFLASDEASFVTGVDLPVDGGVTAGIYAKNVPGCPEW